MYKQKGFTLIELMLVIAIVTLLSSIFMYNTTEAKKKAEDAKMMLESGQIKNALILYKEENGFLPQPYTPASGGGTYAESRSVDSDYYKAMNKLVPDYLSKVPESPSGSSYAYSVSDDAQDGMFVASLNFGDNDEDENDGDDEDDKDDDKDKDDGKDKDVKTTCSFIGNFDCVINQSQEEYICTVTNEETGEETCDWVVIHEGGKVCYLCDANEENCVQTEEDEAPVCSGSESTDYCSCI